MSLPTAIPVSHRPLESTGGRVAVRDDRTPEQIVFAQVRARICRRTTLSHVDHSYFSEVRRTLSEAESQEQNSVAIALKQAGVLLAEAPTDSDRRRRWVSGPLARAVYRRMEPPVGAQPSGAPIRQMPVSTRDPELAAA